MKTGQKFFATLLLLSSLTVALTTQAQTAAFPGAMGFGKNVTGGRAGSVYHVTTLANSGAGSFRDAVSVANRIVVFDVGGYVTLDTEVGVKSNVTIAGQTAPGGGIGIKGAEISCGSQSNIIIRHVRFRPGSVSGDTENGVNLFQAHDVIMDHVSVEFAKWNNIDAATSSWQNFPISGITVQNSIIANPIGQQFGAHTEAPNGTWSWFNNLFANSHNRNPLAKVNTVFINNVLYNCDAGYSTHTSTPFNQDIVNNYFVAGPASGGNMPWFQIDNNQSIYSSGNLRDGSLDGVLNGTTTNPLPGYQGGGTVLSSAWSPITSSYPTVSPASAFRRVMSHSGALPTDQVDALVISQAKTLGSGTTGLGAGTRGPDGALYATETQTGLGNGGLGTIAGGTKPLDTDNDGMPDFWERAFGWNINSADSMVIQADGYARLESYINWLADTHASGNANSTIDLSLTQFTGGFVSSPTFSVSAPVNGTVALVGGNTARFTPTAGFSGLASYNFTVTDSAGSTMTLKVGVLVQPSAVSVPAVPTGLTATAGNTQVSLSWTASSGATSYNVKRATTSGGPYTAVSSPTGTSYVNTGLTNGTTYYYVVSAVNAGGESANSSQASATPQPDVPVAPTGLSATAGNAQVSLSWTASSGATSYNVKRATTSGGPYTTVSSPTGTSYVNTGLTNGTTYYYVVSAVNGGGESANSSQANATPSAGGGGPVTIQIEASTFGGGVTIDSNNAGFNGTGFANFPTTGGFAQFNSVNGGTGGTTTLNIRYALGITTARTGALLINGVTRAITFAPSGAWTTWATLSINITLNSGTGNTIRLESNGGDLGNVDQITVTPNTSTALPSPWQNRDVGSVSAPGSAGYGLNIFQISGSGSGIGAAGTADEFHYVHQTASGDCTIVARVTAVQNTGANAKAGVMIRETVNDNSIQAMCSLSNGNISFIRRSATGGSSTTTVVTTFNPPYWVRMQRVGNVFTASRSTDGVTWVTVGSVTHTMATSATLGLAVTSQADGTLTTATFDNVTATP